MFDCNHWGIAYIVLHKCISVQLNVSVQDIFRRLCAVVFS